LVRGDRLQTIGGERENAMSRAKNRIDLTDAQIAVRAYERWMGRGCPLSDGTDDWFAARTEIEAELAAGDRNAPRKSRPRARTRPSA
jgi:hypothetical protein